MKDMLIIGIAGGTGSGKSTITNIIAEKFKGRVSVIKHDDYYKRQDGLSYEERAAQNYDCPVYDYTVHNRSNETFVIEPKPVLIIDGILILADERLRDFMDIKLFVDTDADIRILRRIKRDVTKRKRTLESVMEQYMTTVKPMHEAFVEPSKKYADIIIPEGGHNHVAMEMLENRVKQHLD